MSLGNVVRYRSLDFLQRANDAYIITGLIFIMYTRREATNNRDAVGAIFSCAACTCIPLSLGLLYHPFAEELGNMVFLGDRGDAINGVIYRVATTRTRVNNVVRRATKTNSQSRSRKIAGNSPSPAGPAGRRWPWFTFHLTKIDLFPEEHRAQVSSLLVSAVAQLRDVRYISNEFHLIHAKDARRDPTGISSLVRRSQVESRSPQRERYSFARSRLRANLHTARKRRKV